MSTTKPNQAQQEGKEQQESQQVQQKEEEKAESKEVDEGAEIMDPDELFQLLLRTKVIPTAAVCKWRDLGIELDLSGDELDLIEQNVQQNPVVPIATKMLRDWRQLKGDALAKDLITAIHNIKLVTYAATLNKEFDPKKELSDKDLQKIIPNIATKWKDLGVELGVRNLDTYEKNPDLTEEKFKRMLQLWLSVKPKPINELCDMIHKGLQGIKLMAAAKQFKENYEKFKTNEALKKLA